MIGRRRFLTLGGASAAAVFGALGTRSVIGWFEDNELDLLTTSADLFSRHIGDTFHVTGALAQPLTLLAVHRRGPSAFTLQFVGDDGLDQGTQPMRHGALGRFDLFLVPGHTGANPRYEAAFNHGGPV